MGIEPNEHQIHRSQGKYSYHTEHSEKPESSYVSLLLVCGILRFCETQCFLVNWRTVEWSMDPLNFSESVSLSKIFSPITEEN